MTAFPTVTTKLGTLHGEALPVAGQDVMVFRGIPYAAPPVGELRFRAPEPPRAWAHARDARCRAPTAPQILGIMRDLPPQSEDCLLLNVWTPGLTGARPVIVFVHGGAFVTGSSQHPMYDGHALAQRGDVVVVSFNYRLGALGYLDLGALGEAGFGCDANNGLRDQIAALAWVRQNIDAFGGDPENIALLGQSAGAMSVCTLLATPSARPLFRRAIAQSGGAHHVTTRQHAARMARLVLDGLGVGVRALDKLRQLPFEQVVAAQAACLRSFTLVGAHDRPLYSAGMTLVPVVDGELLARAPIDAIADGEGSPAPLLLGTNRDEHRFWSVLVDSTTQDIDDAALLKIVDRRLPEDAERVIAAYRTRMPAARPWEIFTAIETDRMFRVPALRLAQKRAEHGQPSHLYAFDFTGPLFDGLLGACHTIEVPFVFGLMEDGFGRVFTGGGADARVLSERMMDAWLAFVRTSDPSTSELGAWPMFDAATQMAQRLGLSPSLQSAILSGDSLWDELL